MLKKFAVAAVIAALSGAAFAADTNSFYVGADVGATKIDSISGNKTSVGIYGGYNFNSNFAAELSYRNLGDLDIGPVSFKIKQTSISAIGAYPLTNEIKVYGRLGYNNIDGEVVYNKVKYTGGDSGILYGIGLSYQFAPKVVGRIEFQRPASDAKNFHVGVAYQF